MVFYILFSGLFPLSGPKVANFFPVNNFGEISGSFPLGFQEFFSPFFWPDFAGTFLFGFLSGRDFLRVNSVRVPGKILLNIIGQEMCFPGKIRGSPGGYWGRVK